jgi:dimethylaniline monooxygenase (N-oxide forming)
MPATRRIAVIGAGASGLVTAKYCVAAGFEVTIFELSERIGGVFGAQAGYDEGALVSSKFLTAFSDFRHADSEPPHVSFLA